MKIRAISLATPLIFSLGSILLMFPLHKWQKMAMMHMGLMSYLFVMVVLGIAKIAASMEDQDRAKELIWASAAPAGAALGYALAIYYDPKPSMLQLLCSVLGGTLCSNLTFIVSMAIHNRSTKPIVST